VPDNPVALSEFDAGLPALVLAHLALVALELTGGVYFQVPVVCTVPVLQKAW
jgi:hypothetical protein